MGGRIDFSGIGECSFGFATVGTHSKYGGLNEETPSLCLIYGETETHWVGRWVLSYPNFFDVLFPKTNVLAVPNVEKYNSIINGDLGQRLLTKHQSDAKRILNKTVI